MNPLIALVILSTLILASCSGGDAPSGLYAGGPGGLVLSFEPGAPPDRVYDQSETPMMMILRVRNTGEYDVENVQVRLSGITSNDFDGFTSGPHEIEEIKGKALLQDQILPGDDVFLDLGTARYTRSLQTAELDFVLKATACYGYATLATASVCMSDNYYTDVSCDPNRAQLSVSAAPVTIQNLKTSVAGTDLLRIEFEVSRSGQRIWAPYPAQSCTADRVSLAREADRVHVRVSDGFDGDTRITCSNLLVGDDDWEDGWILSWDQFTRDPQRPTDAQGYVRLTEGVASVACTLTVPPDTNGVSPIDITATYVAETSTSKTITVTRS